MIALATQHLRLTAAKFEIRLKSSPTSLPQDVPRPSGAWWRGYPRLGVLCHAVSKSCCNYLTDAGDHFEDELAQLPSAR